MLELLFAYWFFGGAFHFVYESFVAPEMRDALSLRLRRLLDELRALEAKYPGHAHRRCFHDLRDSLQGQLATLDRFGVVVLRLIERESRANPAGRLEVEALIASFDRCDVPEFQRIRAESVRIAMRAIAITNGGLLLYTAPVALVMFARAEARARFSRFAMQAIYFYQQFGSAYVRVKHDVLSL
jgi:hypothetical protein